MGDILYGKKEQRDAHCLISVINVSQATKACDLKWLVFEIGEPFLGRNYFVIRSTEYTKIVDERKPRETKLRVNRSFLRLLDHVLTTIVMRSVP